MRNISRSDFLEIISGRQSNAPETDAIHRQSATMATGGGSMPHDGLAPYDGPWSGAQLKHLLRRTLFGFTQADYSFFENLPLDKCLDTLLTPSPDYAPPVNTYSNSDLVDPDAAWGETWVHSRFTDMGVLSKKEAEINQKRRESITAWWVGRLLQHDRSLTEKMTLFWHNQVSAEFFFIFDACKSYKYAAPLRLHALGNFKKMLFDVVTSPGMLRYLSNDQSTAEDPNENLGRELQELFTVGRDAGTRYSQADVMAASRVLTGWATDQHGDTRFHAVIHDTADKVFSDFYEGKVIKGRSGEAGSEELSELLDMILSVRDTALHLSRRLYRWFVYYEISPETEANVIAPLADTLVANDFDIVPALRLLLGSKHFYAEENIGCHIKNPIDHLIGLSRSFGLNDFSGDIGKQYSVWGSLAARLDDMSMCPGAPPNVAGWPAYYLTAGYQLWINSNTLTARIETIDALLSPSGIICSGIDTGVRLDILGFTAALSDPSDPTALVRESTAFLTPVPFSADIIDKMTTMLSEGGTDWQEVWREYTADPRDPAKSKLATDRLRNYYKYLLQRDECLMA